MTRAKVLQLGFLVLLLGGGSYWFFRVIGFEGVSAGIAAEALLVALVFAWTASYLLRVFTGQMTFVEQRKRYRAAYEKLTTTELQDKFQSLSEEEQLNLIQDLEREQH